MKKKGESAQVMVAQCVFGVPLCGSEEDPSASDPKYNEYPLPKQHILRRGRNRDDIGARNVCPRGNVGECK